MDESTCLYIVLIGMCGGGVHVCVDVYSYTRLAKTVVLISVTVAVPIYSTSIPLFKATGHYPYCGI